MHFSHHGMVLHSKCPVGPNDTISLICWANDLVMSFMWILLLYMSIYCCWLCSCVGSILWLAVRLSSDHVMLVVVQALTEQNKTK